MPKKSGPSPAWKGLKQEATIVAANLGHDFWTWDKKMTRPNNGFISAS